MRIGIDCRLSGNAHAGIGRYIENLIVRLPKLASDITWVFFFSDKKQVPPFDSNLKNIELHFVPIRHYSLAEQLSLPQHFSKAKLDLLHVPHFNVPYMYQGPLVVTIHDLLWHEYKGVLVTTLNPLLYWVKYAAYRFIASHAVHQARAIIVPTETVKQTLQRYYQASQRKIFVTKEGVSGEFAAVKNLLQEMLSSKQLVYVGSLYPHKNIKVVLEALKKLPEWKLRLVGSRNVFQEKVRAEVKKLELEEQVTFDGYVEDHDLITLLQSSTALIQPSLSEGFGLTGVEAMSAGVPVIASDIPVFKEVYQEAALFFNPHQPEELANVLRNLDATTIRRLQTEGKKVSRQFSWETMAQETLTIYRSLLHD